MFGRRGVLFVIGLWMLHSVRAFVSWLPFERNPVSSLLYADETAPADAEEGHQEQRLERELARLDTRDYSQQAIPMILACVNLAPDKQRQFDAARPIPGNAAIASRFRQYVEALPKVVKHVDEEDVAKLVELLADRDLAAAGKEDPK